MHRKWYFEIKVNSGGSGSSTLQFGLATAAKATSGAYPSYWIWDTFGSTLQTGHDNSTGGESNSGTGVGVIVDNDVVAISVDFDNGKMYFRVNGINWGDDDPAAGTGGKTITGTLFPCFCISDAVAASATLNVGSTSFADTIPTGFTAWNG
ncbi:SPRY domain-containing protein [Bradyrhizobium sp. MOS002]|uniref:SPRY domain-containing protein n=1 Tax=Bradyrhizobium sp. MOS002 TaxID=2133947 RepID=UPI000D134FF2|nr:hypothetical protein C7G41_21275 [Bradyrhizobium sp. MOS002]